MVDAQAQQQRHDQAGRAQHAQHARHAHRVGCAGARLLPVHVHRQREQARAHEVGAQRSAGSARGIGFPAAATAHA
eukprot:gene33329-37661_t